MSANMPSSIRTWPFPEAMHWRTLPEIFWQDGMPDPAPAPELVIFNAPLADQLGLPWADVPRDRLAHWLSGTDLPDTCRPLSQAYAGHQFGGFTLLGDGRAHLLAQFEAPDRTGYDLQLKGSGRTVYSRGGDGKATLGAMLRECILGEAMHGLGIPTSRALAVVRTGAPVYRERVHAGAVLARIARSHIRVGTFEYAAARHDPDALKALIDYSIARHDPDLADHPEPVLTWLNRVAQRQIRLVIHWLRVGFIHGVMNTDNTFISGETLDYGPCAFLDEYHPDKVFSSIDRQGRYRFSNQKSIILWNLARLAEAVLPAMGGHPDQALNEARRALKRWADQIETQWQRMMCRKIGLPAATPEDVVLVQALLGWMQRFGADYTVTFRALALDQAQTLPQAHEPPVREWINRWRLRLSESGPVHSARFEAMQQENPARIARNHQVERALKEADAGRTDALSRLLKALARPYEDDPRYADFARPPEPEERVWQTFCGT